MAELGHIFGFATLLAERVEKQVQPAGEGNHQPEIQRIDDPGPAGRQYRHVAERRLEKGPAGYGNQQEDHGLGQAEPVFAVIGKDTVDPPGELEQRIVADRKLRRVMPFSLWRGTRRGFMCSNLFRHLGILDRLC